MDVPTLLMRQMEVHTSIRHPPRDADSLAQLRQTMHDLHAFLDELVVVANQLSTDTSTLFQCLLSILSAADGQEEGRSFDTQHGAGGVPMHQAKVLSRDHARQLTGTLRRAVDADTEARLLTHTKSLRSMLRVKVEDGNDLVAARRVVSDAMDYLDYIHAQSGGNEERMFDFYMVESSEALEALLAIAPHKVGARRVSERRVADTAAVRTCREDEGGNEHETSMIGVDGGGEDVNKTPALRTRVSADTSRSGRRDRLLHDSSTAHTETFDGNDDASEGPKGDVEETQRHPLHPHSRAPPTRVANHTVANGGSSAPNGRSLRAISLSGAARSAASPTACLPAYSLPELTRYAAEAAQLRHPFARRMQAAEAMRQLIVVPTRAEFAAVAVEMTTGLSTAVAALVQEKRSALCRIGCDMIVTLVQRLQETDTPSEAEDEDDSELCDTRVDYTGEKEGAEKQKRNAGVGERVRETCYEPAHVKPSNELDTRESRTCHGLHRTRDRLRHSLVSSTPTAGRFVWMHDVRHARTSFVSSSSVSSPSSGASRVGQILAGWVSALVKGIFVTVAAISGATDRALRAMMRMSAGHAALMRAVLNALDSGTQPELRRRCLGYLALGLSSAVASMTVGSTEYATGEGVKEMCRHNLVRDDSGAYGTGEHNNRASTGTAWRAQDVARVDALITQLIPTPQRFVAVGSSACRRMARVLCAVIALSHAAIHTVNEDGRSESHSAAVWGRCTAGMEEKVRAMIAQEMERLAGLAEQPEALERVLFECADDFIRSTRSVTTMEGGGGTPARTPTASLSSSVSSYTGGEKEGGCVSVNRSVLTRRSLTGRRFSRVDAAHARAAPETCISLTLPTPPALTLTDSETSHETHSIITTNTPLRIRTISSLSPLRAAQQSSMPNSQERTLSVEASADTANRAAPTRRALSCRTRAKMEALYAARQSCACPSDDEAVPARSVSPPRVDYTNNHASHVTTVSTRAAVHATVSDTQTTHTPLESPHARDEAGDATRTTTTMTQRTVLHADADYAVEEEEDMTAEERSCDKEERRTPLSTSTSLRKIDAAVQATPTRVLNTESTSSKSISRPTISSSLVGAVALVLRRPSVRAARQGGALGSGAVFSLSQRVKGDEEQTPSLYEAKVVHARHRDGGEDVCKEAETSGTCLAEAAHTDMNRVQAAAAQTSVRDAAMSAGEEDGVCGTEESTRTGIEESSTATSECRSEGQDTRARLNRSVVAGRPITNSLLRKLARS